jgi:hypothetical protein
MKYSFTLNLAKILFIFVILNQPLFGGSEIDPDRKGQAGEAGL